MFAGTNDAGRMVCILPTAWYPPESPCSSKHNVEDALIVDTDPTQMKWWEREEEEERKRQSQLDWASLMVPLRVGAVVIVGAIALGIYFNIGKTRQPVRRQAFA